MEVFFKRFGKAKGMAARYLLAVIGGIANQVAGTNAI